jgi:nucleoside-specific outer membrane channel protein Tsx
MAESEKTELNVLDRLPPDAKIGAKRLHGLNDLNAWNGWNYWNVWNGPIPVMNGAKRLTGLNDWNVWNHDSALDISNDRNHDPALNLELGTLNFNGRKAVNV